MASRLKELAAHEAVRTLEIKLLQGAKPGKGGKVMAKIAAIRGIPERKDSISLNRHPDIIASADELIEKIAYVRELTGKPASIKTTIGRGRFMNEPCEAVAHLVAAEPACATPKQGQQSQPQPADSWMNRYQPKPWTCPLTAQQ